MKFQTIAKVALAGTALASLMSVAVAAQLNGTPAGVKQSHQIAPPQGIGPKKLQKTYVAAGNGNGAALAQFAFTTVDTTTVSCTTTCSIEINAMSQIQSAGADWAICLLIDGGSVSCQYQGNLAGPSSYVVGNASGFAANLAVGSHTATLQLYTESSTATYEYFQSSVRVYK